MFLPLAGVIAAVLFGIQLALCFGKAGALFKWIPVMLLAVFEVGCLGVILIDGYLRMFLPYGAAFAVYIYALMAAFWLAGLMLAWLIYAAVKAVQKRRK